MNTKKKQFPELVTIERKREKKKENEIEVKKCVILSLYNIFFINVCHGIDILMYPGTTAIGNIENNNNQQKKTHSHSATGTLIKFSLWVSHPWQSRQWSKQKFQQLKSYNNKKQTRWQQIRQLQQYETNYETPEAENKWTEAWQSFLWPSNILGFFFLRGVGGGWKTLEKRAKMLPTKRTWMSVHDLANHCIIELVRETFCPCVPPQDCLRICVSVWVLWKLFTASTCKGNYSQQEFFCVRY